MTYFGFLTGFVVLPYVLLLAWYLFDSRVRQSYSHANPIMMLGYSFLILPSLALLYTTPWDNYLVATGVWWYDPALVSGIILGWVPLEEYLFFVLQPMLGGVLLVLVLGRKIFENERKPLIKGIRRRALAAAGAIWLGALAVLLSNYPPGTYLGLELIWALPVIILQLAFGGDILWKHGRRLALVIAGLTLYLSLADSIAIQSGVWTIDPGQSLGVLLGGVLPVEEFVFFLLTNIMVGFGFVLIWSPESHARLAGIRKVFRSQHHISDIGSET
jgi:lycopene cyclase domain-containing protein